MDAVEAVLARDHGSDPSWTEAEQQQEALGRLLVAGEIASVLVRTTAVDDPRR